MLNCINKLRYKIFTALSIQINPAKYLNHERILWDYFTNLTSWQTTYPNNITAGRRTGAKLSIVAMGTSGFITPCIISQSYFTYGSASAIVTLNTEPNIINAIIAKNHSTEWGFKIIENKVTVVHPMGKAHIKLHDPLSQHKFTIDFNAKTNKIYWKIDNITVWEMPDNTAMHKRLVISLHTVDKKYPAKNLPQSMDVKYAEILEYIDEIEKY